MPSLRERLGGLWRHPSSRGAGELILPAGAAPRAAGEQGLADQPMRQPVVAATSWWPTYALNDVSQPNYAKTRALFYNRLPPYRLGAGFARPIINAASGFTGVPTPSPVEDAPTRRSSYKTSGSSGSRASTSLPVIASATATPSCGSRGIPTASTSGRAPSTSSYYGPTEYSPSSTLSRANGCTSTYTIT